MSAPASTRRDEPRGVDVSARPLVGRAGELQALLDTVARPPAVAVLEGEAGIGKTRLVAELRRRPELADRRWALGQCRPIHEPFPLGPLLDVARHLVPLLPPGTLSPVVGALRPLLPELAGRLPAPPPALDDRASERHRVFRALVEILAASAPAVVVVEDLHWSDRQTREFLGYLLADPPDGVSLVLTARTDPDPATGRPDPSLSALTGRLPDRVSRYHTTLGPLDQAHTGQLAAGLLGVAHLPASFTARLRARSSGVPLAIEELVALLRERSDGRLAGDPVRILDDLQVPPAIRAYVLERAGRLPRQAQPVLEAVAVWQRPVPERLVAVVLDGVDPAEVADGLSRAIQAGLLAEEGDGDSVGFRHELAAQAVYEAIPGPRRRRLHARAADVLAGFPGAPLGQLAHHLRLAGRRAEWAATAQRAADQAIELGHDDEAVRLLREVLERAELPDADLGRVAVKLAQAAVDTARGPEVLDLLWPVLDRELPPPVRGELRMRIAVLLDHAGGDLATRRRLLSGAVAELGQRPDLRAWAMLGLGIPRGLRAHLPEHLEWLRRALATLQELTDPAFDLYVRGKAVLVFATVGDPVWRELSAQVLDRTGGTPTGSREVIAYESLTIAAAYAGHHDRAGRTLAVALAEAEKLESRRPALVLHCARALLDYHCGRWDGLADRLGQLREELAGQPRYRIDVEVIDACLTLARDGPGPAAPRLRSLVEELYGMGAVELLPLPAGALVRAETAAGEVTRAASDAERLLDALPRDGAWVPTCRALPAVTDALLAAGQRERVEEVLARLTDELAGCDSPLAPAALRHARGRYELARGEVGAAATALVAAADAYRALPAPYESALAREEAALVYEAAGLPGADRLLRSALADYQRLGAAWDFDRAAHHARRLGVAIPARFRGGRRGYGRELSPRERRVAELAATGRTNKEIARELYVEPDTVNKHLRSAMRKLGVRSRAALAYRLAGGARDGDSGR